MKLKMKIKDTLGKFKKRIDPEIEKFLESAIKEASNESLLITNALRHVKKMVLSGGKRLRPAFMLYGYLAAGGKSRAKIIKTAVSIELIHAFLLIHDDIMDKDNKRHNVDTVHFKYRKIGEKLFPKTDAKHFGDSMGIIVGDMVAALGGQIIFNSKFAPKDVMKALYKLQSIVSMTVVGQAQDIYIEYKGKASEKEILKMYENKTAKYTVEGPLHLGAILGGANKKLLDSLTSLSIPLGIAFQIQDDILGTFGDEKKLGKPVGSDISEGKQTILVSKALKVANSPQKQIISQFLGKENLSKEDIEKFRDVIIDTGALAYAKEMAKNYIVEGKKEIEKSGIEGETRDFLVGIADYMANREI